MSFEHGASAYVNHKCRCDVCKRGKSEKDRQYRENNRDNIAAYRKKRREKSCEYMRRWHAEHKKEQREYNRRWRAENPQKVREMQQRSYDRHQDKRIAAAKEWYENNREKSQRSSRDRYAKTRDKQLEKSREWYKNNRDRAIEYHRARNKIPAAQAAARRRAAQFRDRVSQLPDDRNGDPWTLAEFSIIKRDDLSIIEMAAILRRSYSAVRGARCSIRRKIEEDL